MATKYNIGNIVSYMFGDTPRYKIVATKEQPRIRENMAPAIVPDGHEYLIIKTPLEAEEFAAFIPVNEAHLELISEN